VQRVRQRDVDGLDLGVREQRLVRVTGDSLITAADLGRLLGLSATRLRDLAREGHLEPMTTGLYKLNTSVLGYIRFLKDSGEPTSAQEEWTRAKARIALVKAAEREGSVVKRVEIEADIAEVTSAIKSKVLSIPSKAAPLLVSIANQKTVFTLLTKMAHEALESLSRLTIHQRLRADDMATGVGSDGAAEPMGGHLPPPLK
jgi:hypothetical protein